MMIPPLSRVVGQWGIPAIGRDSPIAAGISGGFMDVSAGAGDVLGGNGVPAFLRKHRSMIYPPFRFK
jgi:hypothetical protein